MLWGKELGLGVESAKLIRLELPEFGLWSMEHVGQLIENGENMQRREMSRETRQALKGKGSHSHRDPEHSYNP